MQILLSFILLTVWLSAALSAPVDPVEMIPILCPTGKFWNNGTCTACSACQGSLEVFKMCTVTTDTLCRCPRGSFFDPWNSSCKKCRDCPIGSQMIETCSSTADTQCSDCPVGSFYQPKGNRCQTCNRCVKGQVQIRPCGPVLDTVCIGHGRVPPSQFMSANTGDIIQEESSQVLPTISPQKKPAIMSWEYQFPSKPFCYTTMCLFICGFIIYGLIQTCRCYECNLACSKYCSEYSLTTDEHHVISNDTRVQRQLIQTRPTVSTVPHTADHDHQQKIYCPVPVQETTLSTTARPAVVDHQQPPGQRSRLCSTSSSFQFRHTHVYPADRELPKIFDSTSGVQSM